MKRSLLISALTFILFFSMQFSFAQVERANEYLDRKGEVYFQFNVTGLAQLNSLTNVISIDNVKGNQVWAYANRNEFNEFLQSNISYTVLDHPGDAVVEMWDQSTKAIWDFDTYPTYSQYVTMMQTFVTNFPNICRLDTIGTTVDGHLLLVLKITDNPDADENEPEFLYTSSMHGDELTGAILMLRLADWLCDNYSIVPRATNIVNNIELWICPMANPDGTYAGGDNTVTGATRYNGNNIDLNRNYADPRSGLHPDGNAWQPETQAFMNFASAHDFVMGGNFHGGATVANYPWDTWVTSGNLHADDAWWELVSKEYADSAKAYGSAGYFTDVISSGYIEGGDWYVIDGGRQDYMNWYQHCREETFEISVTKTPTASTLPNYWNYNYRSIFLYLEQCMYGISGVITDACSGLPVRAKVYVESHDQANDSSHVYSSAEVGDYHRPIYAGTYSVTYSAPGYTSQTLTGITVANKATTVRNVQLVPLAPVAAFAADHTSGCTATVQFTDQSGAPAGSTFLWNFGDGQTSTLQNPAHTYTSNGTYTVTLTITSCAGTDSETKTNYITLTLPTAPTTTPASRCGTGTVSLSASGTGTLNWYDAATGGTLVNSGATYTTPSLSANTTYYVESSTTTYGSSQYVPSPDIATSATYNTNRYLIFSVISPIKLVSVQVKTTTAGNRTIELRNSDGTVLLQSLTVNIPTGTNRITLNWDIPAGTDYRLGLASTSAVNLYRHNTGVSYPYEISGLVSITNSSAGSTAYYFYYDWEVQPINNCISARTPVTATINTIPNANAGTDVSITQGNSTTLTATGGGTYLWSNGETTASTSVTPATTTTYTVTVTGTNGCTASDQVIVTVNASTLAVTAASNPSSICTGSSVNLSATATGGSGYTYSWSSNPSGFTSTLQNPTVTPTVTTTYSVTVTSGANTATSTTTVTVNPIPTAFAGNDVSVCSGHSVTLTATGGGTYLWSNSAGNTASVSVSPVTNTTYTVTVTGTGGCTDTDDILVTVNTTPTAFAGNDDAICVGESATLTATGGNTYLWSNSLGSTATVTASPTSTTNYTVTVTAGNGCTATDQVTITVNALPVVNISGNTGICPGGQTTLTASGGTSYIWSDGLGTNSSVTVNPSSNQTYYVTATNSNGCSGTGSVTVTLYNSPTANAGTDQSITQNNSTTLNASATGGSGSYNYLWSPGASLVSTNVSNPSTVNLSSTTVFTVTVTDALTGCTSSDEVVITVTGGILSLSANATPNQICQGSTIQLNALPSGGTGSYTYSWTSIPAGFTSNNQNPVVTPNMNSVYFVTVNDGVGSAVSSVSVTVLSSPAANAGSDVSACPGAALTLNATGGDSYSWSTGDQTQSADIIVTNTVTYTVTVVATNGCTDTDDVTITAFNAPTAEAGTNQTICEGATATLTATGGVVYTWSDNAGNTASVDVAPVTTTVYTVTVEDNNGCTAQDQVTVNVNSLPQPSFTYVTNQLNVAFTNTSQSSVSYMWYFGDGGLSNQANPNYNYANEGVYTVMLIATNSCGTDTAIVDIEVMLVGNHETDASYYNVYPNPAKDNVYISFSGEKVVISVTDLTGRVVFVKNLESSGSLDLENISSGIYNLNFIRNNSIVCRSKLIIE